MKRKSIIELIVIRKKKKNYHHSEHYKEYNLQLIKLNTTID